MIRVFSLFSGIGAFEKALKRQNINYELVNYCELDKYASKAYSLIHNESENKNLGDITKINEKELSDFDLMTWGFPCTDISVAGKQKGFIDESGNITRSGLYYEGLRILQYKKPKYSIIENVKALTQKKFEREFKQIFSDLENAGYNNYYKILNAKDYGIPQNRERIFIISIRKDIDNLTFSFSEGFDNGIRLKDILQTEVDEKYYISQEKTDKLITQLKNKDINNLCINTKMQELQIREDGLCCTLISFMYKEPPQVIKVGNTNPSENGMNGNVYSDEGIAPTITTNKGEGNKILQVGMLDIKGNELVRRVYNPEGLSPTLNTMGGGNRQPKILEDFYANRNVREYDEYCPTLRADRQGLKVVQDCSTHTRNYIDQPEQLEIRNDELSNSVTTVQKDSMAFETHIEDKEAIENISSEYQFAKDKCMRYYNKNGYLPEMFNPYNQAEITNIAPKQTTSCNRSCSSATVLIKDMYYRIRKLTPLECFRLMGFDDNDYYILKDNKISDSQIYKMAGNSIVVNVLENIFIKLFKN